MAKRKNYYAGGKKVFIDGAPCKVAAWVGELGNDREYLEAIKPNEKFKAAYYEGGHRMIIEGVPVRVAAQVKSWAPWMKRALGKGAASEKEIQKIKEQLLVLGLISEQSAAKAIGAALEPVWNMGERKPWLSIESEVELKMAA